MKKIIREFLLRGLIAGGFGPIILAIVYLALQRHADLQSLSVSRICIGIFSLYALAFLAGGMNVVYQIERLPLMVAILLHGSVLYLGYLVTYLVNDWQELGIMPVLVFTFIFVAGYLLIWAVIYFLTRRNTEQVNAMLTRNRQQTQKESQ